MLAFETVLGTRVVASPATLDATAWPAGAVVLRIAPDDVFVLAAGVTVSGDEDAIIADESGFSGCWLSSAELDAVAHHIEWTLPSPAIRPAFAQGSVAGVPCKLWLAASTTGDRVALLLTHTAYAHELANRLPSMDPQ